MKGEERVIVYGSLGLRKGISDLLWAFRKSSRMEEFPAYLDDHPFQVIDRIRNEVKNGVRTADVVVMPHYAVTTMGMQGLLSGYQPTGAVESLSNMRGLGNGSIPVGVTFMAMAYNTKRLDSRDLPTGVASLAGDFWKGRLGVQSLTASRAGNLGVWYLSFLRRTMKSKEWAEFTRVLAADNRPQAYDCIDHLLQGLVDGEIGLALTVYSLAYFREKMVGSPVALVHPSSIPHMFTFTSASLLKGSDENGAAKRFMNFLLTPEAQKIIGSIPGIGPIRKGLRPSYDFEHSYGVRTVFHPVEEDFETFSSTLELFRRLRMP